VISIKNILIITGQNSYSIIKDIVKNIKKYDIKIYKAPITISAFLSESLTESILNEVRIPDYDLVLLPGFVQWDTKYLEKKLSVKLRKGPEFASDLPNILKNLDTINLSTQFSADKLMKISGEKEYETLLEDQIEKAKKNLGTHTFYINKKKTDLIIGRNLPPPIIAEIVNCPKKTNDAILKKVHHYIDSGANIIDIGCIANKPDPERVKEIIRLINSNFNTLISIDSMEKKEILAAVDEGIDMILSFDFGNYKELENIPKTIPVVILPTNLKNADFPKYPAQRVKRLIELTKKLSNIGFEKLIADPLLETPITPGICNSLESYFLYKKIVSETEYKHLELPMFFGISNVVELMDIDSVGINGLLASMAIELDIGVLFTVEHSNKLMGGVHELFECMKLSYIGKRKNTPPINQGISIFKAKGKISEEIPKLNSSDAIYIRDLNSSYIPDEKGYFRFYVNHYSKEIYVLFYSNNDSLLNFIVGNNAEALSKKIMEIKITDNLQHINYLGRELSKAESCLLTGKPYIQDE
jgi:dihydropteroate synthase-like protein